MRTITKVFEVYKFKELPQKIQELTIIRYTHINLMEKWWDFIYEDAKNIGLEITCFDIFYKTIEGKFLTTLGDVCKNIIENHGETTNTYNLATEYLSLTIEDEDYFLKSLLNIYLKMIEKDYYYLISDESIKNTLIDNEYEFMKNGEMYFD